MNVHKTAIPIPQASMVFLHVDATIMSLYYIFLRLMMCHLMIPTRKYVIFIDFIL